MVDLGDDEVGDGLGGEEDAVALAVFFGVVVEEGVVEMGSGGRGRGGEGERGSEEAVANSEAVSRTQRSQAVDSIDNHGRAVDAVGWERRLTSSAKMAAAQMTDWARYVGWLRRGDVAGEDDGEGSVCGGEAAVAVVAQRVG